MRIGAASAMKVCRFLDDEYESSTRALAADVGKEAVGARALVDLNGRAALGQPLPASKAVLHAALPYSRARLRILKPDCSLNEKRALRIAGPELDDSRTRPESIVVRTAPQSRLKHHLSPIPKVEDER
jgi:hypothetical protein